MTQIANGTVIDRYVIEGVLGQGGMAMVYRVRHRTLDTQHAMKVLTIPSQSIRKRLIQEGKLQASLGHPNIVAVMDVVDVDGAPGLVMELIRGPSLDKFLSDRRPTLPQIDLLVHGILEGVGAAHARGMIHRDLKPANIMLAVTPNAIVPKVTDFGLAKVLGDEGGVSKTRSGVTMGTPAYMSPEQIRNAKSVDVRADVFSLGAILYEMVTGRRAYDGEDLIELFSSIAAGRFVPPRDLIPDLPVRMELAILGALVPDREKRIRDVATLGAVWRGEVTELSATAPGVPSRVDNAWGSSLMAELSAGDVTDEQPRGEPGGGDDTRDVAGGGTWSGSVDTLAPEVGDPVRSAQASGKVVAEDAAQPRSAVPKKAAPVTLFTPGDSIAPADEPVRAPSGRSRWLLAGVGGGAVAMVAGGVALVALAATLGLAANAGWFTGGTAHADSELPAPSIDASAPVVIVPTNPVGSHDTEAPPVAAVVAPTPPSAQPVVPAKRVASSVVPVKPVTASTPPPVVVEAPPVVAEPAVATPPPVAPPVETAPAAPSIPAGFARVGLTGDAQRVWLQSAAGNVAVPGDVPAGTYKLQVFFDANPLGGGEYTFTSGQTATFVCTKSFHGCRLK